MKNIIRKILGIVFVFCAIVLLIWNENKFINNLIRKNNIVDKCIFVKSTSVDSKNDDKSDNNTGGESTGSDTTE